MCGLLGPRPFLVHYGGRWGLLKSGRVVPYDYKGGRVKKLDLDGDELCFREVKKELAKLLQMNDVDLDTEDGFRISSINEGMVFSVSSDKTLMLCWNLLKPDIRGLYHLFTTTTSPTYEFSPKTLRSTNQTTTTQFLAPRKLHYSSSSASTSTVSQIPTHVPDPILTSEVVSDWEEALRTINLDEDHQLQVIDAVPSCGDASYQDTSYEAGSVDPDSDDEEVCKVPYDVGPKYGPTVTDEEVYWSDHSSQNEDVEDLDFVPSDVEGGIFGSDSSEGEDLDGPIQDALFDDGLMNEGEETRTFIKMATNVYQDDMNNEVDDVAKESEIELKVGLQWPTMKNCRSFFKRYAIRKKIMFRQKKNNKKVYKILCKDPSCEWWVLCSRLSDGNTVELKLLNSDHTCSADVDNKNAHANAPLVASELEEFVRTHPDCTPMMMAKEIKSRQGVKVTYWIAWEARRRLLEKINGNYEEGFKLVPDMCKNILKNNEVSSVKWYVKEDTNQFVGLFIGFKASLQGWVDGCRPIIGLDGCFLKGKYGGACLSAMGLDAMNGLFPLAIYITTGEHNVSWSVMLCNLQPYVNKHPGPITFMSDRKKGLIDAVQEYYPKAYHRFCFRHMYKNFKRADNKGDYLEQLSWGAARSLKECEHLDYMAAILQNSEKAHSWLGKEKLENWARHKFYLTCNCDKLTNNFSESFNAWILKIRDKPLVQFMDKYILSLSALLYQRRSVSRELESDDVVPSVMHTIGKYQKKYHKFTVEGISDYNYMAMNSHGKMFFVDLQNMTCTCVQWQLSGVPCIHAVAVLTPRREPWAKYCSKYYSVESFRATYKGYIFPLNNIEEWTKGDEIVLPPTLARQPGRPKKMRIRDEDEPQKKSKRKCTVCGLSGHNISTCLRRSAGNYTKRKAKEVVTEGNEHVAKRGRGRPPKEKVAASTMTASKSQAEIPKTRKSKRNLSQPSQVASNAAQKRGRKVAMSQP